MIRKLVFLPPAITWAGLCAGLLGGCSAAGPPQSVPHETAVLDASASRSFTLPAVDAPRIAELEPNDDLLGPLPIAARFDSGFYIDAELDSGADVDIFNLGPLARGSRLSINVTSDADTHLKLALMNGAGDLVLVAYPAVGDAGSIQFEHILRSDADSTLLAVAALGPRSNAIGTYVSAVSGQIPAEVPGPEAQIVFVNFDGADLSSVPDLARFEVPAFDAADIDDAYAGMTGAIVESVAYKVAAVFAGSGVRIVTSLEGLDPAAVSTVHVGAVGEAVLGLAQSVDAYNANRADQAVVFVQSFRQFLFLEPTPEEISTALANVVCHEAGHLLGLNHTQGRTSLMDVTSPLSRLLQQRYFGRFPLERGAFPVGFQDAPALLHQTVGGNLDVTTSYEDELAADSGNAGLPDSPDPGRPLPIWYCPTGQGLIP